jgi:hypothetical protein
MKLKNCAFITSITLLPLAHVLATPAVDELLTEYRSQGAEDFSSESGKILFFKEFTDKESGKIRQCTSCHTDDLRKEGQHATTGEIIEPLAPSVNQKQLTDIAEIRKWLKRNCKWTLGRECTPQEKGDSLTFIQTQ